MLRQVVEIGYYSLPVVGLTAIFTGMVLALQSYTGFSRFSAESAIPNIVVVSVTRELGPVLAGLMVAGRVGAAIAAEIGTMRVTEQIDALTTLSTNPVKYLIVPRVLAATLMLPLLVAVADIIGVFGGYLVGVSLLGLDGGTYVNSLENSVDFGDDVLGSLLKAWIFGMIVGLIATYRGYTSEPNAAGVSRATTSTVVMASVCILVADYFFTALWGV